MAEPRLVAWPAPPPPPPIPVLNISVSDYLELHTSDDFASDEENILQNAFDGGLVGVTVTSARTVTRSSIVVASATASALVRVQGGDGTGEPIAAIIYTAEAASAAVSNNQLDGGGSALLCSEVVNMRVLNGTNRTKPDAAKERFTVDVTFDNVAPRTPIWRRPVRHPHAQRPLRR